MPQELPSLLVQSTMLCRNLAGQSGSVTLLPQGELNEIRNLGRLGGYLGFGCVPPPVSGTPEESLTGDGNGVKTGAKIVRHGRSITFQMAEVMVSRRMFQQVLDAIGALRPLPSARF